MSLFPPSGSPRAVRVKARAVSGITAQALTMKFFEGFDEEAGGKKALVFSGQTLDAILNLRSSGAIGALPLP